MEQMSTAEFYDEIKLATANTAANARKISDYMEQTKSSNVAALKDVFMTKDDKNDLTGRMFTYFVVIVSTILTVGGVVIGFAVSIMSKLSSMETVLKIMQEKIK